MKKSLFIEKITAAVNKKEYLYDKSFLRYALRSFYAGIFLTLTTAAGAYGATKISHIHPDLGKFCFSFLFAWGLVYILFLNSELATSNMMYLSAGVYLKKIKFFKALKILMVCTLFNLIGAMFIGYLFTNTNAFKDLASDSYIVTSVLSKIGKNDLLIIVDGFIANIFVNIAILGYLLMENQNAKIAFVLSAVFSFVYLGNEHVIANFSSFSIFKFNSVAPQYEILTWFNIFRQWFFAFIGNLIGGGIFIGVGYSYLNQKESEYLD